MPLKTSDPEVLLRDGCQLADPPGIFRALVAVAPGHELCTTGCAYFNDGKCPAFRKWHTEYTPAEVPSQQKITVPDPMIGGKWAGLTVKQIAQREGITETEAKKRRKAGQYKC